MLHKEKVLAHYHKMKHDLEWTVKRKLSAKKSRIKNKEKIKLYAKEYGKRYYQIHKEEMNEDNRNWKSEKPDYQKAINITNKYNISYEKYIEIFNQQNGCCAICEIHQSKLKQSLCVDHDHSCCPEKSKSCGKCIRFLLCDKCNRGLGYFNDSVESLRKAVELLDSWKSRNPGGEIDSTCFAN